MTTTLKEFEESYRIKIVDFQYTPDQMRRILAAAFEDGNCVDDGGRYDWRAGSSITVWARPDTEENEKVNTFKAIFYYYPGTHDPLNMDYLEAVDEMTQHVEFNDNKFGGVWYPKPYTYDDALAELGMLEQRAVGRVVYGRL